MYGWCWTWRIFVLDLVIDVCFEKTGLIRFFFALLQQYHKKYNLNLIKINKISNITELFAKTLTLQ